MICFTRVLVANPSIFLLDEATSALGDNEVAWLADDLKGKTISVPFASTAHGMLLRAIEAKVSEGRR